MKIEYDKLSAKEKTAYVIGYITGVCSDCEQRYKNDDADKVQGSQPYCKGCGKKVRVDYILRAHEIDLS